MVSRLVSKVAAVGCVALALACASGAADKATTPVQDPQVLRFAERAISWYPGSTVRIVESESRQTPSGSYRLVTVERTCDKDYLSGTTPLLIDDLTGDVWIGSRGNLPTGDPAFNPAKLDRYVEGILPELLKQNMDLKVRVEWESGLRAGALIPFVLRVDTGYGEYRKPAAVSADGKVLTLGARLPLGEDPVRFRRELLAGRKDVVWDHGKPEAKVELVELSDFQCPGCKAKWTLIKKTLDEVGEVVRHGFVSFPLNTIHPWAFRAACAGHCVAEQRVDLLLPLKELFYSLQRDMSVGEVTPTAQDFVAANGLDQARFDACYLKTASLDGIHGQMTLGNRLGVTATPTYFVNGWLVQVPDEAWCTAMVRQLAAGEEP